VSEHVWSVVCATSSVDDAGVISLLSIVERLTIWYSPKDFEEKTARPGGALPIQMEVVSWWVRTNYAAPETGAMRAGLITPNGGHLEKASLPLQLETTTGCRTKVRAATIPFKGLGLYWWVVEKKRVSDLDEWEMVARIPIELICQDPNSISFPTAPAPPSEPTPAVPRE
jgi:hypothetical protein